MRSILVTVTCLVASIPAWAQPFTLDQVLAEAKERNLGLLVERFGISMAEARIVQAKLRPNPVFSTSAIYLPALGSQFDPVTNIGGPPEVNGRIDFLVERGRKRQERINVAEGERTMAQLELLDATRSLIYNVESAFTDVLLANEKLTLANASLDTFNRIVEINRSRVNSGDLARVEFIRSEVAALQFSNQVRQAELQSRLARNRLQALMGRTLFEPTFSVVGDMRREPLAMTPDDIKQLALKSRPDLEGLRKDYDRSVAFLRLQIANGKIDYTVGAGVQRQIGVKNYGGASSASVYLSVPLPVFNKNQGEIERARQEQQRILARIKALEQDINSEVQNSHAQFLNAKALLDKIEGEMLDRARQTREITDFSYRRGEATFVELLDAQRAYNETMQAYQEARAEYARSLYLIDSITNKGTTP